jgi:Flp pilus assembly protein TadG
MARSQPINKALSLFARFRSDIAGVAAVEFGLLAPLLLLMTFGTIELSRALIIHKRFQRSASMVADLVTREKQLWPETMTDTAASTKPYPALSALQGMMSAAEHAMRPYSVTPLSVQIYQVWVDPSNSPNAKVEWSYGKNWTTNAVTSPSCGQTPPFAISKTLLPNGGRAVFATASYAYRPLLTNLLPDIIRPMTWHYTIAMIPRDVPSVMYIPGLNNGVDWKSMSTSACQ